MNRHKTIVVNNRKYEVFSDGSIFSFRMGHNWKSKKRFKMKPSVHKTGYHSVLIGGTNGTQKYVHRIVASLFCKNPKNKKCVNHKNGIKSDNRSENLEWVTYSENHLHAYRTLKRKTAAGKNLGGGVCYDKNRNKWMVYTGSRNTRVFHGRFETKEEAWNKLIKQRKIMSTNQGTTIEGK